MHSTAPVLFESTGEHAAKHDPANEDWVALLALLDDERLDDLARRYFMALYHFRKQQSRPSLPGQIEIEALGKQQASEAILEVMEERKAARKGAGESLSPEEVFVEPLPDGSDASLPAALADFSVKPPTIGDLLCGPGRPPCDAGCLMRAFLAAPLLGVSDNPTDLHRLLHSNPTFASLCGFFGPNTNKLPGELTSRGLPGLSTCEEFDEVMTRYGLWDLARMEQVVRNLKTGVVETEQEITLDTTHIEANSHCGEVVPPDAKAEGDKKPKQRKVPRLYKRCDCGKDNWETCLHAWVPTDQGAAVVVKGLCRIYWAHKASVAAFADSEIPIDVRVCLYAAEHDSKTLMPHLELLARHFPQVIEHLLLVMADDGYRGNPKVIELLNHLVRLILPVHPRRARSGLAEQFDGIDHFTPVGFPICKGEHRFELRGRDIIHQKYIWVAPDDEQGKPVCTGCPFASSCLKKGKRRNIRVDRKDQPQIDWDHPQLFVRDRARYQKRTGVERAIKRLKVDLKGELLTHRDAHRVQAHLDRKLLTLHLLLEVAASP